MITNWAILGCGKIAKKFAGDLNRTAGANLYAVASRDSTRAIAFREAFNADTTYGSYEKMVQDPKVDIVYIATPHVFHKEQTLLCLAHKKAVLCEKAFAMNLAEVEEMIAFAKAQNTFLMEALWTHFVPHFTFVLQKVQGGEFGKIRSIHADFGFNSSDRPASRLFNKSLGGGSLLDVGVYTVFVALTILGYTEDIRATAIFGPTDVDLRCKMMLRYPNAVTAQLQSAIDRQTDTICRITLEKGEILINSPFYAPTTVTITQKGVCRTYDFPVPDGIYGYHYEILHCQEMLATGAIESDVMTFEKSTQLIKMLDKIREEIGLDYSEVVPFPRGLMLYCFRTIRLHSKRLIIRGYRLIFG